MLKKFEKARSYVSEKKGVTDSKFVKGLPRSEQWVRIQLSEDRSQEVIERTAKENELSYRLQENGYVLVYGNSENLKTFIKKIKK